MTKMQPKADTKEIEVEATITQVETEAGPTMPVDTKLAPTEQGAEGITPDTNIAFEKSVAKEAESHILEAPSKGFDYIVRHASGKRLSEEEFSEAKHYARELQYPKGALVFNSTTEDDFLYCLPDNKELSVCREMGRSMGFPKLEASLPDFLYCSPLLFIIITIHYSYYLSLLFIDDIYRCYFTVTIHCYYSSIIRSRQIFNCSSIMLSSSPKTCQTNISVI
jgi:Tat protein secretion system quality control protein TatD with DNase activity